MGELVSEYTPTTNWVRIMVGYAKETAKDRTLPEPDARQEGYDWFDRWFASEIEKAEQRCREAVWRIYD